MRKLAKKTSKMMSKFEPPKKCQFYLDGLNKEDSHFWLSKLLLKKRKFEIELEFVIFSKKLLSGKNSTFFTSNKNSSILGKKTSSHSSFLVLTKTYRPSKTVVDNFQRPILKLHSNPQIQMTAFWVSSISCF